MEAERGTVEVELVGLAIGSRSVESLEFGTWDNQSFVFRPEGHYHREHSWKKTRSVLKCGKGT